jgi:hypothetical protein
VVLKGYFTFLIVFAAFALLLSLVQLNLNSKSHDTSTAIWTERFYRVQMNVKEVIVEAAREGAADGFDAYCAVTPPDEFSSSTATASINAGIMDKMAEVMRDSKDGFDDEIEVQVLCDGVPAELGSCNHITDYPSMPLGGTMTCNHELESMILRDNDYTYTEVKIILTKDSYSSEAYLPSKIKVEYS